MSQNISDQPKGAVPQAVADDVAVLASEVRAIQRKAAAAWKTALGIWIILLLVIFSYLYFGVFRLLKKNLEPATVAQLVIGKINDTVEAQGFGRLDSAEFPRKAAEQLKKMAPTVMQDTVKPILQAQLKNLPELRKKYHRADRGAGTSAGGQRAGLYTERPAALARRAGHGGPVRADGHRDEPA